MKTAWEQITSQRFLLFLTSLAASAIPAFSQTREPSTNDHLPDRPGVYEVDRVAFDPLEAKANALPDLRVRVEGNSSFSRESFAYFTLMQKPGGLLGRIDLVSEEHSSAGAMSAKEASTQSLRLFLHGQEKETVRLAPGRYTLRAAFWRSDQPFPIAYPRTAEVNLQSGQTAVLELARQDCGAIKAWLRAVAERDSKTPAAKSGGASAQKPNSGPNVEVLLPGERR